MQPNQLRFMLLCLIAGYFAFTFWGQNPTSAAQLGAPTGGSHRERSPQPGETTGQSAQEQNAVPNGNRAQPPGEATGRSALLVGAPTGQTAHMRGTCTARIKSVAIAESGRGDRANLPVAATGGITLKVSLEGIASRVQMVSTHSRFSANTTEVCSSGVCEIPASAGGPYRVQFDDCPPMQISP